MIISPSIMGAQPWDVKDYVESFEKTGIDMIHFDVLDGNYAPNISIGTPEFNAIHKISNMAIDLHLMVINPDVAINYFNIRENDWVSFHPETIRAPFSLLKKIRDKGAKAGIALSRGVSLDYITELEQLLDFVIIMGVDPGFSGQKMLPGTIEKVQKVLDLKTINESSYKIMVDGDCSPKKARKLIDLGIDGCVVGSALINNKYPAKEFDKMLDEYMIEFNA